MDMFPPSLNFSGIAGWHNARGEEMDFLGEVVISMSTVELVVISDSFPISP
jgi:hypothetical protein